MLSEVASGTKFIDKILVAIFDAATEEANEVWMANPGKIFDFPLKRIGGVGHIYVFDGHNCKHAQQIPAQGIPFRRSRSLWHSRSPPLRTKNVRFTTPI